MIYCHIVTNTEPDQANRWYRPPFCACKPYAQEYRDSDLGLEEEHLDIFDVDSTDSEDDEEDGWKKFPKKKGASCGGLMKSTITSRSTQVSIYIPHPKLFASCNYFERNTNGDLSWPFFFFFSFGV